MLSSLVVANAPGLPGRAPGKFVEVTQDRRAHDWQAGGITVRFSGCGPRPRDVEGGTVTISARATTPVTFPADCAITMSTLVGIGPLVHGKYGVVVQRFTGGNHCCHDVFGLLRDKGRFRKVAFGSFDGVPADWPKDQTGDGIADFVFRDDAFLYQFSSYAGSYPPPRIMTIRGRTAIDISAHPAFHRLFAADLASVRKACVASTADTAGACAAYAADAARLGRFAQVWPQVLKAVDMRIAHPTGCDRPRSPFAACHTDYAAGLKAFLVKRGYLR
ncbi:hypothetical protein [Sphingomonas immobilis]|uniref:Uncharacterized protein n=1 Tax=Sphingomonas immobilis TaxID=3063997 RepID=A0ABT9A225_9SPHN|nr:hypothetical protein [Sphingomonas sp. CA1-15]MDO7843884.1 hypothetical protein [Sphingomonas sp. CA1-15]